MRTINKAHGIIGSMTSTTERIRKKYPDKCPVLINFKGNTLKLIVPKQCTFASLMMQVRIQLKKRGWFAGNKEKALFLFTENGRVLSGTQLVQDADTEDGSGAIVLSCTGENTFGGILFTTGVHFSYEMFQQVSINS